MNKRHGLGAMTYRSGDKYEGHWHQDRRHGQAQYVSRYGDVFNGLYKNDLRDGPGTVAKVISNASPFYWLAIPCMSGLCSKFQCKNFHNHTLARIMDHLDASADAAEFHVQNDGRCMFRGHWSAGKLLTGDID